MTRKNGYQLVTFQLGHDCFGVDINCVEEIIKVPEITKIPRAPLYVEGVANLRGNIFPVIDTHKRFNLDKKVITKLSRVIVIKSSGYTSGMIVDRILEVLRLKEEDVEHPPAINQGINEEFLKGIVKIKGRDQLLMVLDLNALCKINIFEAEEHGFLKEIQKQQVEKISEELLVSFMLSDEEYAIKIFCVKEIIRLSNIVKIPNSPDYVIGLLSLRNELLPIIDLKIKLNPSNIQHKKYSNEARVIVIDIRNILIGFLVDEVMGIIRIPKNIIEPPPNIICEIEAEQLFGIAKLGDGQRLILLVNLEKIISYAEIKQIGRTGEEKSPVKNVEHLEPAGVEENLIAFKLGREEFCISISQIQEINRMHEITKLPNAPDFIDGIINLRGVVVPVINLRKRFGMDPVLDKKQTRIIIINIAGKKIGLIVDSVSEVLRIEKNKIEPLPDVVKSKVSIEFMSGIIKLSNGKRMPIMLNLERVLSEEEKKEFSSFEVVRIQKNLVKNDLTGNKNFNKPAVEEETTKTQSQTKKVEKDFMDIKGQDVTKLMEPEFKKKNIILKRAR